MCFVCAYDPVGCSGLGAWLDSRLSAVPFEPVRWKAELIIHMLK